MSSIKLPNYGSFYQWFMDLNRSRPDLIVPIPSQNDEDWRKWAMLLISTNKDKLSKVSLPLKGQFPDNKSWRKWAYFLIQNIENS